MSREQSHLAVILKKQPFGDADELVTVFTEETGKLRVFAKSIKLSKSKLQHALQVPFLVKLRLAGGQLPKVIGAEVVNSFPGISNNLQGLAAVFYILELVLKFSPDGQSNPVLFNYAVDFLNFVNQKKNITEPLVLAKLVKFQLDFLSSNGFEVSFPKILPSGELFFNHEKGGFVSSGFGGVPVSARAYQVFVKLKPQSGGDEFFEPSREEVLELNGILSQFLEYQLQRKINSSSFLGDAGVV